jgi:hypothetical protein
MAISPLDQRLDKLNTEVADFDQRLDLGTAPLNDSIEAATIPEIPPEIKMADGEQIAGGRMEVIGEVLKRIGKQDIRPTAPPVPLTPEAAKAQEISELQKAAVQTGVGTPAEAKLAGQVQQAVQTAPTPQQVIAEKPGMAGRTDEKPPETAFNMPLMDTEESVKQTMMVLAERVETQRGTFKSWEAAAEAAGLGPKFIQDVTSGNLKVSPENVILASKAQIGIMEHLDGLLAKVADGSATPTELAEATQAVAFSNVLQQSIKNYQTNIAQSLAVMRMPRSTSQEVVQILEQFGNQTDIVKFAQAYLDVKTPEGKADLIRSMAQGNVWEKLYTVYVNGILSRPGTHVKNFLSNTVFLPVRMAERGAAAGVGKLRTAIGIGADDVYQFAEVPSMLSATPVAVRNGWQLMAHAFTNGVPKGWTDPGKIARQQARMELFNYTEDNPLGLAVKALNTVVTLPGRSLMAADEFFKGINYTYELVAEATRTGIVAYDEALKAGKSAEEATVAQKAAVDQFLLEPPEYLTQLTEVGTFTQKLTGRIGQMQEMMTPNTPMAFALKTQIPFISTPVNVMSESLQRTPLAPLTATFREAIKKGGKEADLALTKMGLGTAAMYGFTEFATSNVVTGSGPGEKGTRDAMIRQGWQPYSIVLDFDGTDEEVRQALSKFPGSVRFGSGDYAGKVFLSYQGLEPVGALMAMAADYADYARYEQDDSRLNAYVGGAVFGIANYILESPFLQGVSNITTLLGGMVPNSRQQLIKTINGLAEFATTAAIKSIQPLTGTATTAKEQIDPLRRDYQMNPNAPAGLKGVMDALNKWKANTPGLSEGLPPLLNIWSEPVEHEYTWSPLRMKEGKMREVDQALIQLNANVAMPARQVSMPVQVGKEAISSNTQLTAEEYNQLLRIANGPKLQLEKQVLAAVELIKRNQGGVSVYTQQNVISKVFSDVFEVARKQLLQDPEYGPAIQERIKEKANKLAEFGKGAR